MSPSSSDRKNVYFISDLHLGAQYLGDTMAYEKRVVHWLDSVADDAAELYLLGDILDYWYEYRYVVPRGYVRFFGALASLADRGVKITWFIGNHDIWIRDYLPREIGLRVVDGYEVCTIMGKRFFLSHGDGIGNLPWGFRFIRAVFRNRLCQLLYSSIHPRWTVPFAYRWSAHSRDYKAEEPPVFSGRDDESYIVFARDYLRHDPAIDYFILGHHHIMLDYELSPSSRLVILGDWIHYFSYGVFSGDKVEIRQFID